MGGDFYDVFPLPSGKWGVALLALSVPAPDQAAAATGAGSTAHTTAAPAGEEH